MITKQEKAGLELIALLADTIKTLGEVPSGHIYARVMHVLSLEQYNTIINILKNANIIEETNGHLLKWVPSRTP
jgi:hypothetical protein